MPLETDKKDPKGLFLQLFATIALYISFGGLLNLLYGYINNYENNFSYFSLYEMRLSLSCLIIAFPVYVFCCYQIKKMAMPTRKFFVYLTLFLAAIIILYKLIMLLLALLTGIISRIFILKLIALVLLTAGTACFYVKEARESIAYQNSKLFMSLSSIIVIVAVVYGFSLVGSPTKVRLANQDEARLSDLSSIQSRIGYYYAHRKQLPTSLATLTSTQSGYKAPVDPVTQNAYGYHVLSPQTYELCASFALNSSDPHEASINGGPPNWSWQHGIGQTCFTRNITDL
ncbi:MAG: DUF5671 domain-containing protein [Gammaproteobacteria bacterium]|nr:DUF5671 domain-containing protein [Gammaproteobacteria bacterium]